MSNVTFGHVYVPSQVQTNNFFRFTGVNTSDCLVLFSLMERALAR